MSGKVVNSGGQPEVYMNPRVIENYAKNPDHRLDELEKKVERINAELNGSTSG
jgi:tetrahydromethanopterin S-methyltransferase subunit G